MIALSWTRPREASPEWRLDRLKLAYLHSVRSVEQTPSHELPITFAGLELIFQSCSRATASWSEPRTVLNSGGRNGTELRRLVMSENGQEGLTAPLHGSTGTERDEAF